MRSCCVGRSCSGVMRNRSDTTGVESLELTETSRARERCHGRRGVPAATCSKLSERVDAKCVSVGNSSWKMSAVYAPVFTVLRVLVMIEYLLPLRKSLPRRYMCVYSSEAHALQTTGETYFERYSMMGRQSETARSVVALRVQVAVTSLFVGASIAGVVAVPRVAFLQSSWRR
jgi:hypothetical protein